MCKMICKRCGATHFNTNYCPTCGYSIVDTSLSDIKEHINASTVALIFSIVALAISGSIPIAGIVLSCVAGSKINNLPFISENELEGYMLEEYNSSKGRIRAAKTIKNIALPLSIINLVFVAIISFVYYIFLFLGYM